MLFTDLHDNFQPCHDTLKLLDDASQQQCPHSCYGSRQYFEIYRHTFLPHILIPTALRDCSNYTDFECNSTVLDLTEMANIHRLLWKLCCCHFDWLETTVWENKWILLIEKIKTILHRKNAWKKRFAKKCQFSRFQRQAVSKRVCYLLIANWKNNQWNSKLTCGSPE